MRALHDPLRQVAGPNHRLGVLDLPTKIRLRPLRHTGQGRLFLGTTLHPDLGGSRAGCCGVSVRARGNSSVPGIRSRCFHTRRIKSPDARCIAGRTTSLTPDLRKPRPTPRLALSELVPQRLAGVGLTRITSTTRLRTRRLFQLLHRILLACTTLSLDLPKPMLPPLPALPELLPQPCAGVGLTRITSTTSLRTRFQPLPLLLSRRSRITRVVCLHKPRPRPRLTCVELRRQRLSGVGLALGTSTAHLLPRRFPLPFFQIQPVRTTLIADFPKPRRTPHFALPEFPPQRRGVVGRTCVPSTTCLRTSRFPLLLRQILPTRTTLAADLPKPLQAPLPASPELLPQRRAVVRRTRVTGTTGLRTRRLFQLLHITEPFRPGAGRPRGPALGTFIDRIIGMPPLASTAFTNRNRSPNTAFSVLTRHQPRLTRARRFVTT